MSRSASYIKADYRVSDNQSRIARYSLSRLWLPLAVCGVGVVAIFLGSSDATSTGRARDPKGALEPQKQQAIPRVVPLTLPEQEKGASPHGQRLRNEAWATADQALLAVDDRPLAFPQDNATSGAWHEVTIKKGDTLSSIFSRLDIYRELQALMDLGSETEMLGSIYPGENLHIRISDQGMEELIFDPDDATRLNVVRTSDGNLEAELHKMPREIRQAAVSGMIEDSLYLAGAKAGLPDQLIMKMAELFGWDVDFALDIRKGDAFTVIYEGYYRNGEKVGGGDIIAAEFTNQGQIVRVMRYTDSRGHTGYYRPDGRSVRRPFLRTPVEIARISSPFNLQRRHPILNTIRAHRGVDYAAPTGTPIRATGDGVVVERGTLGGYGLTIVLRHGNRYTTLYGHMSDYAGGTSVGQYIRQGQIIGYIGSTGLATGPHLHYEFRVDGMHQNPLTVALPAAQPLPEAEMAAYLSATKPLTAELDAQVRNRVAMN